MRIVQINMVDHGSTGKIMFQIADRAEALGHEMLTFSARHYSTGLKPVSPSRRKNHHYFGTFFESLTHSALAKLTGRNGLFSVFTTYRLLRKIKKFRPDIIHLHNLHNFCINLPMLFRFIKKNNISTVWTLHDCWTMTGHCPHFDSVGCDRWKTGCHHCPIYSAPYLKTYVDASRPMWKNKKKWFTGVSDMTLVPVSQWLGDVAKTSYLKDYPIKVIRNGIDLSAFKPTDSPLRQSHNMEGKKIVLGVSAGWDNKKGLDVFLELSRRLPEDYVIVLVGANNDLAKRLPANIIPISHTRNQTELAKIYTAADVFANPTREDSFPTVNIESLACGTPVVTFKTGGSPEIIDETCGIAVEKNDIDAFWAAIKQVCEEHPFSSEDCIRRSLCFDKNQRFEEYVKLYEDIINGKGAV